MLTCPSCQSPGIPDDARYCPFCGAEFPLRRRNVSPRLIVNVKENSMGAQIADRDGHSIMLNPGENVIIQSLYPWLEHGFALCRPVQRGQGGCAESKNSGNIVSIDLKHFKPAEEFDGYDLFLNCNSLSTIDLTCFSTTKFKDVSNLFCHCYSLVNVSLSALNTANCSNFTQMFDHCTSLREINISSLNAENVTNCGDIFSDCINVKTINCAISTPALEWIHGMFSFCKNLETIDMCTMDFSHVKRKIDNNLFHRCNSLKTIIMRGCNDVTIDIVEHELAAAGINAEIYV